MSDKGSTIPPSNQAGGRNPARVIVRDFLLGFARIHVLLRAAQGPVYGLALLEEWRQRGYGLGPGTLYPLLHGLEATGYLARENQVVEGRVRKYYVLTPEGARSLAEARVQIRALVSDVLDPRSPARQREPHRRAPTGRLPMGLIRPEVLRARLATSGSSRAPIVIDVRSTGEYVAGHIPGARHILADELARQGDVLPRRLHVTYCNMRHRGQSSVRAAMLLRERGHRAQALAGGFPAWVAAGYPVDRGAPP